MTSKKKTVLFVRLPDEVEAQFQSIRKKLGVQKGKPIKRNNLVIRLIQDRYNELTDPSQRSCGTEMEEAAEPQTPASELDTPPPETCTSEAHSV